jgi:hypothetical protein
VFNKDNIPYTATNRLLKFYQTYRFQQLDSEEEYQFLVAIKNELNKREHVETKGRRHEKRKNRKQD